MHRLVVSMYMVNCTVRVGLELINANKHTNTDSCMVCSNEMFFSDVSLRAENLF